MTYLQNTVLLTQQVLEQVGSNTFGGFSDPKIAVEDWDAILVGCTNIAVKTRDRSTRGRGMGVIDTRKGIEIWYLDQASAHVVFRTLPVHLWQHIDTLLQTYRPIKEAIVLRLTIDTIEIMFFEDEDRPLPEQLPPIWNIGPVTILPLPLPLVQAYLPALALPPEVIWWCEYGPASMSYIFTHDEIGEVGRIQLLDAVDGSMYKTLVVTGFLDDPLYTSIHDLISHLQLHFGIANLDGNSDIRLAAELPPMIFPSDIVDPIATTVLACDTCACDMVFLIFGDHPCIELSDYAQQMRTVIQSKNLITFVIGFINGYNDDELTDEQAALCMERFRARAKTMDMKTFLAGDPDEKAILLSHEPISSLLQVWPIQGQIREVKPTHFKQIMADLSAAHCR